MIYKTIAEKKESLLKEKGSKFIARIWPAADENEIESILHDLRKKYHDATHHCFAWRLGQEGSEVFRYSDDGEPSGTAGKPIYDILIKYDVTNVLLVVTRYFGGTKLGTGGLVRAYAGAADELLNSVKIITVEKGNKIEFIYPYEFQGLVDQALRSIPHIHAEKKYAENIHLVLECHEPDLQPAIDRIYDVSASKILGKRH